MINIDQNTPISPEGKAKLYVASTESVQEMAALVDQVRGSIRMIDEIQKILPTSKRNMGDQKPDEQHHLRRLSEYTLVVGLIYLDINSAIRIYSSGTEPYDTIYATKQLLITLNEGYKQIYHYVSITDGVQTDDKRKQSYWVKDIGRFVKEELPNLLSEYNRITRALDLYDDEELKKMTKPRSLAIHYDKNASDVYDMLMQLNIEMLVKKVMPFIAILNDMVGFCLTTLSSYNELINERTDKIKKFHISKLEGLKTQSPEASDLLSEMQEFIRKFGEQ